MMVYIFETKWEYTEFGMIEVPDKFVSVFITKEEAIARKHYMDLNNEGRWEHPNYMVVKEVK